MDRIYQAILQEHFSQFNQMAFCAGPRQSGKTTIADNLCQSWSESLYLNWDFPQDRALILSGSDNVIQQLGDHNLLRINAPLVVFDEIHKFKDWKNYLKGYFDYTKSHYKTLITGSAKLNVFNKGGGIA